MQRTFIKKTYRSNSLSNAWATKTILPLLLLAGVLFLSGCQSNWQLLKGQVDYDTLLITPDTKTQLKSALLNADREKSTWLASEYLLWQQVLNSADIPIRLELKARSKLRGVRIQSEQLANSLSHQSQQLLTEKNFTEFQATFNALKQLPLKENESALIQLLENDYLNALYSTSRLETLETNTPNKASFTPVKALPKTTAKLATTLPKPSAKKTIDQKAIIPEAKSKNTTTKKKSPDNNIDKSIKNLNQAIESGNLLAIQKSAKSLAQLSFLPKNQNIKVKSIDNFIKHKSALLDEKADTFYKQGKIEEAQTIWALLLKLQPKNEQYKQKVLRSKKVLSNLNTLRKEGHTITDQK